MTIISLRPLYDSKSPLRTIVGLEAPAHALAFSPDGKYLAAVVGQRVMCWRLHDSQVQFTAPIPLNIDLNLSLSPDGQVLCGCGTDKFTHVDHVYLWPASAERDPLIRTFEEVFTKVEFSPGSDYMLLTTTEGMALINTTYRWPVRWLKPGYQESLTMSADGCMLASINHDDIVRLWGLEHETRIGGIELVQSSEHQLLLSARARFLAVGGSSLLIWDIPRSRATQLSGKKATPCLFSLDEHILVATQLNYYGGSDPDSDEWESHKPLAWRFDKTWHPITLEGGPYSLYEPYLAISQDNRRLIFNGSSSGIWDLKNGERIYFHGEKEPGPPIYEFDADGRRGLTIELGFARVIFLETGQEAIIRASAGEITSAIFSPNNAVLAAASDQGTIDLWRVL